MREHRNDPRCPGMDARYTGPWVCWWNVHANRRSRRVRDSEPIFGRTILILDVA